LKLLGGATLVSTLAAPLLWAPPAAAAPPITAVSVTSVVADELSLHVTWSVTGTAVSGDHYVVKAHDPAGVAPDRTCDDADADWTATDCWIENVKAGVTYTVTVEAQSVNDVTYGSVATATDVSSARTPIKPVAPNAVLAAGTGVSGQVYVSWTPQQDAHAVISNFTATAYLGGVATDKTCTSASDSVANCKVNGLTNDTEYTFRVVANGANSNGNSLPSTAPGTAATPSVTPGAPSDVTVFPFATSVPDIGAMVYWKAPSATNIATYDVAGYDASTGTAVVGLVCTATAPDTWCDPSDHVVRVPLTAGDPYYFKVTATTVGGQTSAAAQSPTIIPTTAPDAPTDAAAVAGSGKATVTWKAPVAGATVGGYRVTAIDASGATDHMCTTASATALTCQVTGLTNGTEYTFSVASVSALGTGTLSLTDITDPVTPLPAAGPGVPTSVQVTAGVNQIAVSWTAASTNPAPALSFTATASPGDASCSTGNATTYNCTITGLTAGTAYTVTVVAHGADADSDASAASDSAMPLSPSSGNTVSNANGQLQIFVRGTNDHLYTSIRAGDGTWGVAVDLGYPIVSAPTVIRNANGRLDVFVLGYDHSVFHRQQVAPNSTTWSAWARVGAAVWTSNFVIEANDNGKLQMFGRDAAGNVRTAIQTVAGEADWTELSSLGGLVYSDPTVASTGGKLEVFAIGYDGLLWHRMQSAANSTDWTAWTRVGGSLTSIL
jgi:hypothetical protein